MLGDHAGERANIKRVDLDEVAWTGRPAVFGLSDGALIPFDISYAPNEYKGWRRAAQSAILSPKMVSEPALVVYTRPDCSYSDALLHDLDKDGVAYRQVNLEERPDLVGELERLTGGERMTPVMVEGDLVIVGYHGVG